MELSVSEALGDGTSNGPYSLIDQTTIFALFIVVIIAAMIIIWLMSRQERKKRVVLKTGIGEIVSDNEPIESPEIKRLREREERVKALESSVKDRRLDELKKREAQLLDRQASEQPAAPPVDGGTGRGPASPPTEKPEGGSLKDDSSFAADSGSHQDSREQPSPLDSERDMLKKMIRMAEEKYSRGEISKDAFSRIETDYYKKLIDLEIRIREEDGPGR